MKKIHISIYTLLFTLLIHTTSSASVTQNYLNYNTKIGQLIFKGILITEQGNSIFNLWANGDVTTKDAITEFNKVKSSLEELEKDITSIREARDFSALHEVYAHTLQSMIDITTNHMSFIETTDLKSTDIREKLRKHLLGYIAAMYECQSNNNKAQLTCQKSLQISSEPSVIKEYFTWNNQIIEIMGAQMEISKAMEKMMINLSLGGIDLESAQNEEKELLERATRLMKKISSMKTGASVKQLQEQFTKSFQNYLDFHQSLSDYLTTPSREKSKEMSEKSRQANKMNFDFNEACVEFLKKHSDSGTPPGNQHK